MTSGELDKGCSSGRFKAVSILWFTQRKYPPTSNEKRWLCRGEDVCEHAWTPETCVTASGGAGAVRLRESTGCSRVFDVRNREVVSPAQGGCTGGASPGRNHCWAARRTSWSLPRGGSDGSTDGTGSAGVTAAYSNPGQCAGRRRTCGVGEESGPQTLALDQTDHKGKGFGRGHEPSRGACL